MCQEISAGIMTLRGSIEIGLYLNPGDFFTKNKAWFENSMGGGGGG